MQPVEHRQGCQGNPDASRCLHRPPPPASPEDRYGGAGCASAASAPRGPCVPHGCVGSVGPPRAARHRAPGSNSLVCSSADLGRSGCKAGPGPSTVRTGTSGRNRPYAPRAPSPRCWTDASQRATLRWHRLHRHGVGCGAVDQPPSDGPPPCPTYFGIAVRCTTHGSASITARRATARSKRVSAPLQGPIHHDMLRPPPGGSIACLRRHGRPPGVHAGEELMRAAASSRNHRFKHRRFQNRVLTAE